MKTSAAILLAIAASATAAEIRLAWDANPEPDIARYEVSYESATDQRRSQTAATTPAATISGLTPGVTYAFEVVAINTAGLRSEPSESITATAPDAVTLTLERSTDLGAWVPVQTISLPRKPREFFRLKLTTNNTP